MLRPKVTESNLLKEEVMKMTHKLIEVEVKIQEAERAAKAALRSAQVQTSPARLGNRKAQNWLQEDTKAALRQERALNQRLKDLHHKKKKVEATLRQHSDIFRAMSRSLDRKADERELALHHAERRKQQAQEQKETKAAVQNEIKMIEKDVLVLQLKKGQLSQIVGGLRQSVAQKAVLAKEAASAHAELDALVCSKQSFLEEIVQSVKRQGQQLQGKRGRMRELEQAIMSLQLSRKQAMVYESTQKRLMEGVKSRVEHSAVQLLSGRSQIEGLYGRIQQAQSLLSTQRIENDDLQVLLVQLKDEIQEKMRSNGELMQLLEMK